MDPVTPKKRRSGKSRGPTGPTMEGVPTTPVALMRYLIRIDCQVGKQGINGLVAWEIERISGKAIANRYPDTRPWYQISEWARGRIGTPVWVEQAVRAWLIERIQRGVRKAEIVIVRYPRERRVLEARMGELVTAEGLSGLVLAKLGDPDEQALIEDSIQLLVELGGPSHLGPA